MASWSGTARGMRDAPAIECDLDPAAEPTRVGRTGVVVHWAEPTRRGDRQRDTPLVRAQWDAQTPFLIRTQLDHLVLAVDATTATNSQSRSHRSGWS